MRVELTDEQEFLREAVAGTLARGATAALVRSWAEFRDTGPADQLAIKQGWTGISLSEDLGGQGGGIIELAVMAEELGRVAAPWDRLLGAVLAQQLLGAAESGPAGTLAAETAEGEQVAILLADGRRGPGLWPEPVLSGDALTLEAAYVPGAAAATTLVVAVETGGGPHLFGVDPAGAGVTVTPRPLVDHTRSLATVALEGASARDLGPVPEAAAARAGAAAAVLVSADALGAAAKMLELTTAYVADRRQFGVPVGSFQAVKHAAAEMLVDVEAARSAVRYASWAVDADAPDGLMWGSIAKSHTATTASRVADKALFLHGAVGYTWEHDLQFPFKRAKSDAWLFGSADHHRDRIAGYLALSPELAAAGPGGR